MSESVKCGECKWFLLSCCCDKDGWILGSCAKDRIHNDDPCDMVRSSNKCICDEFTKKEFRKCL